jgi:integrase
LRRSIRLARRIRPVRGDRRDRIIDALGVLEALGVPHEVFRASAVVNADPVPGLLLLYRAAGLPERGWHNLRHAFGTHAAMFGVNPWKLMLWMGHKRIDETMLYVHFAEAHLRPLPEPVLGA